MITTSINTEVEFRSTVCNLASCKCGVSEGRWYWELASPTSGPSPTPSPRFFPRIDWTTGLAVAKIVLGHEGSLDGLQAPVVIGMGNASHPGIEYIIDGRNDGPRSNVVFEEQTSSLPVPGLRDQTLFPNMYLQGLAPSTIYLHDALTSKDLTIFGSDDSRYRVMGEPVYYGLPFDTVLHTGRNGVVTSNLVDMDIIGATQVTMLLDSFDTTAEPDVMDVGKDSAGPCPPATDRAQPTDPRAIREPWKPV